MQELGPLTGDMAVAKDGEELTQVGCLIVVATVQTLLQDAGAGARHSWSRVGTLGVCGATDSLDRVNNVAFGGLNEGPGMFE